MSRDKYILFKVVSKETLTDGNVFPLSLGPLGLAPASSTLIESIQVDSSPRRRSSRTSRIVGGQIIAFGQSSEKAPITLPEFVLAELGIPSTARTYAWCYPDLEAFEKHGKDLATIDASFFRNGGFLYFDESGCCDYVLAVTDDVKCGSTKLAFGQPEKLSAQLFMELKQKHQFCNVTLESLLAAGAKEFAWVNTGDISGPHGAFVYQMETTICQEIYDMFPSDFLCTKPIVTQDVAMSTNYEIQHNSTVSSNDKERAVSSLLPQGPRICILGGRKFQSPASELLVKELAKMCAKELNEGAIILTGGLEGIQETFAESFGITERVFNMVPRDSQSPHFSVGTEIIAGNNLQERVEIYGNIGDIYLTVEGGPGVSKEARAAFDRDAVVLPMIWTGGASGGMFDFPAEALKRPYYVSEQDWLQISEKSSEDIAMLAQKTSAVVVGVINRLIEQGLKPRQ